jgi:hypothetical protein
MPAKYESCVKQVSKSNVSRYGYQKYNPYAVCRASMDRKGMGAGKGSGYFNMVPLDSHIHSMSAMGKKQFYNEYVRPYLKKGDKPYNRQLFNDQLDFLEKEGLVNKKRSHNWTHPDTKMFAKGLSDELRKSLPQSANVVEEDNDLVFIKAGWSDSTYPNAKELRNNTSKELRKLGFVVKSKTFDFTDLSRSMRYTLEATNPDYEFHSMGGWRKSKSLNAAYVPLEKYESKYVVSVFNKYDENGNLEQDYSLQKRFKKLSNAKKYQKQMHTKFKDDEYGDF